jgi:phosphoribosylaminoimidazolecarboxamide formyltransferase/IMP cyclohydrolase
LLSEQNHKDVLIVVDNEDYPGLLEFLKGDQDDQQFRRKLAWKAFQHCASYDSAVSEWLWKQTVGGYSFDFTALIMDF